MTTRYFTLEEANALLPRIEPLMARLLERRAKAVRDSREIQELLADVRVDVGGPIFSELALNFAAIQELILKIQSFGCQIKDLNAGLLDFLTERDGRDVYLCWRFGEPAIEFYHELHMGYNNRRPV